MVTKLLSSILMLTSVMVFSQSIVKGEVKDTSGKAIPNAKVEVEGAEISTITNEKGEFSIVLPSGREKLTFSADSFHSFTREVSVDIPVVYITLNDGSKEISELVLSAHKKLQVNK